MVWAARPHSFPPFMWNGALMHPLFQPGVDQWPRGGSQGLPNKAWSHMLWNACSSIKFWKPLNQVHGLEGKFCKMEALSLEIFAGIEVSHVFFNPTKLLLRCHEMPSCASKLRSRRPCFGCELVDHLEVFVRVIVGPAPSSLLNGV